VSDSNSSQKAAGLELEHEKAVVAEPVIDLGLDGRMRLLGRLQRERREVMKAHIAESSFSLTEQAADSEDVDSETSLREARLRTRAQLHVRLAAAKRSANANSGTPI
jgi:hypothetical protein